MNQTTASPTIILGIETTTTICSVALWDGEQLHQRVSEAARSHSRLILPMVAEVLSLANLSMDAVDAVACARGPGSFTGLRIGIGVAKGLAYGQEIPIVPVSPLAAIAFQVFNSDINDDANHDTNHDINHDTKREIEQVTVMTDARMGELYVGDYTCGHANGLDNTFKLRYPLLSGKERLTSMGTLDLNAKAVAGTGVSAYAEELNTQNAHITDVVYPYAADIVSLARMAYSDSTVMAQLGIVPTTAADFKPVYLRDKVTD